MAESGQLPFRHHLASCVVSKALRWLSLKGREDVPLVLRANQLLLSITNNSLPPIAPLSRKIVRSWNQSPPLVDLSLLERVKADDPPVVAQQHFNSLISRKYFSFQHIFTDGSVADGKVGYGIYCKSPNTSIKSSLPPSCSIFSAEAYALMRASSLTSPQPDTQTIIFSDSASCLKDLLSSASSHPWLHITEHLAKTKNIVFCWVPGHKGILGNVEADRLAGDGRDCETEAVPIPSRDAVRWTKDSIRESWDSEWFRNRNSVLRRVKPTSLPWPDNPNPRHRRVLSRLRTGHTRLTHQHRLDKTDPPTCSTCNLPLTVQHIITDCRQYDIERSENGLVTALELALSPPFEKRLLRFLQDTGLYKQI